MLGQWIKRYMPRTLYGRATAILLLPVLTIQLGVTIIFVQRHFEDVARQLTQSVIREIQLIVDEVAETDIPTASMGAAAQLEIDISPAPDKPSGDARWFYDISGRTVIPTLRDGIPNVIDVDLSNRHRVGLTLITADGPILLSFSRNRVSARNPHQLLVLLIGLGGLITLVAFFFLRNQLRPIKRLADAAEAFGRGETFPYRPQGAVEVRIAGQQFLQMRKRIERHMDQRTMMLSGVSHDLRTPLTRLQLGLALIDDPDAGALLEDIAEMQRMLDAFLNFARDNMGEAMESVDIIELVAGIANRNQRAGSTIETSYPDAEMSLSIRVLPVQRALENLVSNAQKFGDRICIGVIETAQTTLIYVEDNGPGIPAHQREEALRPFTRLEPGRSQSQHSGVGLGLAIAADVARAHGGELRLRQSAHLGGLRAEFILSKKAEKMVGPAGLEPATKAL